MPHSFNPSQSRAIFITGYPKSGTTLLLSLLDNHPQLVVLPEELKYFHKVFKKKNKLDILLNKTGLSLFKYNKITLPSGERNYSDINYKNFAEELSNKLKKVKTEKQTFLAVIETFANFENSRKSKKNKVGFVEKTPGNEHYIPILRDWFGDKLTCLHILRNPLDNFASYRKKHPELTVEQFCLNWALSRKVAKSHEKSIDNLHIIKYEDLVENPAETMGRICGWLGINWSNTLLAPTLNGNPWSGNSMHGKKFNGISSKPTGVYKGLLDEKEIHEIKKALFGFSPHFQIRQLKYMAGINIKQKFPEIYKKYKSIKK